MNTMQILNQLYAMKKVRLQFESEIARENFRQNLYKMKKGQDAAVSAILDEEKLVLKAKKLPEYMIEFWLEEKKAPSYVVISITDGENSDTGNSGVASTGPSTEKTV